MALVTQAQVIHSEPLESTEITEGAHFYMPDLLRSFPWNKGVNKHYEVAKEQSDAWIGKLRRIPLEKQAIYSSMDFPYLAAGFYPGYVTVFSSFHILSQLSDNVGLRRTPNCNKGKVNTL